MDQNLSQNQNRGLLQKYKNYLLGAGVIVVIVIVAIAAKTPNRQQQNEDQNQEQINGETEDINTREQSNQNQTQTLNTPQTGNVSARGRLVLSDNPGRGNLMIKSDQGKIYISTRRDFRDWLEKEVTLVAAGTLHAFTFLGFEETMGTVAGGDGSAIGGPVEEPGTVQLTGRLEQSDDQIKGKYLIVSGTDKIYLKSQRDYSAWLGSEVDLTGNGTVRSFVEARLSKR